jgi:hypothetical protein
MKAAYRCSEQRQGDRCRLEKGHEAEWHRGNFTEWKLGPDGKPGVFRPLIAIPPIRFWKERRRYFISLEAMFRAKLRFLKASAK